VVGFKQTPPANLPPLTKSVLDTLAQVQHNYLYFEAYFSPKGKELAEKNIQQLITGDKSAKQYLRRSRQQTSNNKH